jgi:phospholipid/cholesterol/gamma-HCH transport system ATP-binding protein
MAEAVISLRQLNITFGTHTVLDNIDLDVYKGETLAVLGPSGTGKSTVLRSMIGLLEPNGGQIFIQGEDVSGLDEDGWNRLRMKMGMVFQYSALFDFLTVGENVAFGLRQHTDKSNEEIQGIVTQMLELVGLPGTQDLYPAELSGGMKKRVGLARAIAVNPEIVLYDEPTAGLDPIMSRNISRLIKKTQEQLHVTSVLVTHDMQSAFYAADRVAMLYEGHIVAIGTAEEMKNSTNPIVKAFIEGREIKEQVIK